MLMIALIVLLIAYFSFNWSVGVEPAERAESDDDSWSP